MQIHDTTPIPGGGQVSGVRCRHATCPGPIYVYIYVYVYVHVYIYIYIYTHTHTSICMDRSIDLWRSIVR